METVIACHGPLVIFALVFALLAFSASYGGDAVEATTCTTVNVTVGETAEVVCHLPPFDPSKPLVSLEFYPNDASNDGRDFLLYLVEDCKRTEYSGEPCNVKGQVRYKFYWSSSTTYTLTISNATLKDAGDYLCKNLIEAKACTLVVEGPTPVPNENEKPEHANDNGSPSTATIAGSAGVVGVVLIIIVVVVLVVFCKRRIRNRRRSQERSQHLGTEHSHRMGGTVNGDPHIEANAGQNGQQRIHSSLDNITEGFVQGQVDAIHKTYPATVPETRRSGAGGSVPIKAGGISKDTSDDKLKGSGATYIRKTDTDILPQRPSRQGSEEDFQRKDLDGDNDDDPTGEAEETPIVPAEEESADAEGGGEFNLSTDPLLAASPAKSEGLADVTATSVDTGVHEGDSSELQLLS